MKDVNNWIYATVPCIPRSVACGVQFIIAIHLDGTNYPGENTRRSRHNLDYDLIAKTVRESQAKNEKK